MTRQESNTFYAAYTHLDNLIDKTRNSMIPLNQIANLTPVMTRTLVVTHCVLHATTVQLHNTFARANDYAKKKTLSAAEAVLEITASLNLQDFTYVNPIMAVRIANSPICSPQ
jgi:hypothetical protein